VVLAGVLIDILSPSTGVVNSIITFFGGEPFYFMANEKAFPWVVIISDVWKTYGYSTVFYLAAMTAINPELYEAATIDGANILQRIRFIILPGIMPTVILLLVLSMGSVLNAGFEQILLLMNPMVRSTGEIIDTMVYRLAFEATSGRMWSLAAAVGLFKSFVSMILISISYYIAYKVADYRVF